MPPWTPAQITTALWLDAADSSTITLVSGKISQWADKSGNGRHVAQSSSASRPTLTSGGLNSLDVATFDGANSVLVGAAAQLHAGNYMVAAVVQPASASQYGMVIDQDRELATSIRVGQYLRAYSGKYESIAFNTSVTAFIASKSPVATSAAVICASKSGTTVEVYADGISGTSANLTGSTKTGSTEIIVGGHYNVSNGLTAQWYGIIAEIVFVGGYLLETMHKLQGYLAWKWGLQGSLPAGHPYKSAAPTFLLHIAGPIFQGWNLLPDIILSAPLAQSWLLLDRASGTIDQPWYLRLGRDLVEPWTSAPVRQARLSEPWQDAGALTRPLVQSWQDTAPLTADLAHEWDILAPLAAGLVQPWAIAADAALVGTLGQGWDLRDVVPLAAPMGQPWSIGEDGALLRYTVAVTVGGVAIGVSSISIEADRAQDVLSCELHPETEGDWLRCVFGAPVVVTLTSDAGVEGFRFVVTAPRVSEQHGEPRWVVEAMSPAALLGDPWGVPVSGELSGLASAIAASLVAGSGVALSWATVDWSIPPACWIAADERPLALLKTLAAAVGAVVQSHPDGSLVIEPDYPVSLPAWASTAPGLSLTETLDVFTISSDPDYRPGYNRYLVGDQSTATAADGLRLEEETVSATVKLCRGYQVPWVGAFTLAHTGGSWVQIEALGVETRQETETVEFVSGSGRTQYPIYSRDAIEWLQTNLGSVTVAEDGTLTAAIAGQSLLRLTYTTRCRQWRVRDARNEQLQLVAEL